MSPVRVLVVEDFEPFRRFISSTLKARPEWQIQCEVSDGLEAVEKAGELQPDVILLDIGLPTLNGIEAARQIQNRAPTARILFLSENRLPDVVKAALSTGASGYLLKSDAGAQLLPAIEMILQGKRYLDARLVGHVFKDSKEPCP
jgi:DNA-binding NarL/FixJ family response regulator